MFWLKYNYITIIIYITIYNEKKFPTTFHLLLVRNDNSSPNLYQIFKNNWRDI